VRFLDGAREQRAAETSTHEPGYKTEIRDLDRTVRVALELEVSGRSIADEQLPHAHAGLSEVSRELVVGPVEAIMPEPGSADVVIQTAIQRDGTRRVARDARGGIRECFSAKLRGVVEREVRADDLDAPQASAP
jgi:hypothetical protein